MFFNKVKLGAVCLSAFALVGCATSSVTYEKPPAYQVKNEVIINKPFNKAWADFLRKASGEFFVINNVEKASGILNLSFSTNKPEDYIDCGITTRNFKNLQGDVQYQYNPAQDAQFSTTQGVAMFNVNRKTTLEGRVNVLMEPYGNSQTRMTVNTKYVFTVQVNATNASGYPAGSQNYVNNFTTKQPLEDNEMNCAAKGTLEQLIIDLAK